MTAFASDLCTDTDYTNLTAHTSTSGHTWLYSGIGGTVSSSSPAKVISNVIRPDSASGDHIVYYLNAAPASAIYTVTCDVVFGGLATDLAGPCLGLAASSVRDSTSHGYVWHISPQTPGFRLRRYDGQTPTNLATPGATLTSGVTYRMTIGRATGGVITGKVQRLSDNFWLNSSGTWVSGETDAASVTDTTYTAADRPGITAFANNPYSTIDNFSADETASGATATTLSGPSSGTTGVASTNFTVGANGTITGTVTVTPSDAANGGTFTPTSVAISSGTPTATFTYTPASTGVKTISISDDGGLTDATPLSYTSNAAADTTAPTLTSPTGTQTGSTTASGTVTTDEANGTLYYLASTNSTETAATVKAASSQTVTATGSQSVNFTGLTASTTYYAHYVHRDAAGNDSTVANSASFTTSAGSSPKASTVINQFIAGF